MALPARVPPRRPSSRPRRCGTCRFYQPSPVGGRGWCTHPVLRGPNIRSLVDADTLACNRKLYDFWEPAADRPPVGVGLLRPAVLLRLSLILIPAALVVLVVLHFERLTQPRAESPPASGPTAVPPTPTPEFYRGPLVVTNTGGLGVYLRAEPANETRRIRAWPERTWLEALGEETEAGGRRWVLVRDPAGNTGWVPAEYVERAGP